jgi:hypothetical protein
MPINNHRIPSSSRRPGWLLSSATLRIAFAILLGLIIVLAFFGTSAMSH